MRLSGLRFRLYTEFGPGRRVRRESTILRIVGTGLRTVEEVTGRMTKGRAALFGAGTGAWFGTWSPSAPRSRSRPPSRCGPVPCPAPADPDMMEPAASGRRVDTTQP